MTQKQICKQSRTKCASTFNISFRIQASDLLCLLLSVTLRVFEDNETSSPWKKNVKDIGGEILCVSQFTLMASTTKNKPDFHRAMVRSSFKKSCSIIMTLIN